MFTPAVFHELFLQERLLLMIKLGSSSSKALLVTANHSCFSSVLLILNCDWFTHKDTRRAQHTNAVMSCTSNNQLCNGTQQRDSLDMVQ